MDGSKRGALILTSAYVTVASAWIALELLVDSGGYVPQWILVGGSAAFLYALTLRQHRNLHKSQANFQLLLESFSDFIWFTDAHGKLTQMRGQHQKFRRGRWGDDDFQCWWQALHPDDEHTVKQGWQEAVARGTPFFAEFRLRMDDGDYRYFQSRAIPMANDKGLPQQWVGITTDIHERRQAEMELGEKENNLRLAIEGANIAYWEWNITTGDVIFSEQWLRQLGMESTGPPANMAELHALIHPEDLPRLLGNKAELEENPTGSHCVEYRLRHQDGSYRWMLAPGTIIQDENDHHIGLLVANIDITERKLTELELEKTEQRLQMAIKGGNVGLWEWDLASDQITYSVELQKLLGYQDAPLSEDPNDYIDLLHPDERDAMLELLQESLRRPERGFSADFRMRHRDGHYRWLHSEASMATDEDGEAIRITGVHLDITDIKTAEKRLEHLATHDDLLDLPNRRLMTQELRARISRAGRERGSVGLMFVDLDDFKSLNESIGHSLGDELLKFAAARIGNCIRDNDLLCRPGGDEYIIIIGDNPNRETALQLAHRVLGIFDLPFNIESHRIYITATIGVSLYPADTLEPDALVRYADAALHKGKSQGRNRVKLFDPEMEQEVREWIEIKNALQNALQRRELSVVYQPKLELTSNRIIGFEALVRWHSAELGFVPPDKFITVAESCGMIQAIGEFVLTEAANQVNSWKKMGIDDIRVAVNISVHQFRLLEFARRVKELTDAAQVSPDQIELEITETGIMDDIDNAVTHLSELTDAGFKLAIDDFGTGHSSLNYLRRLQVDCLKIDKSFIDKVTEDATDGQIVAAIITLAHNLGMSVVAEGVETREQLDFLREHDCESVQGYFISKPVSAADATLMLETNCTNVTRLQSKTPQ